MYVVCSGVEEKQGMKNILECRDCVDESCAIQPLM